MEKNIFTALSKMQAELPQVRFDAEVKVQTKSGASYKFEYATLCNVVNSCQPILSANGFAITQPLVYQDGKQFLKTILGHETGSIESMIELKRSRSFLYEKICLCFYIGNCSR
jgi:hypothetical protein